MTNRWSVWKAGVLLLLAALSGCPMPLAKDPETDAEQLPPPDILLSVDGSEIVAGASVDVFAGSMPGVAMVVDFAITNAGKGVLHQEPEPRASRCTVTTRTKANSYSC
jgi:hypothetical protein